MSALISAADVKAILPLRQGNTSYDQRLSRLCNTASRVIESECRQSFTRAERTETFTARDTIRQTLNLYNDGCPTGIVAEEQILILTGSPVDATQPVTVWYDPLRAFGDDTLIDATAYALDAPMSRILLRYPTRYTRSAIRARYTAGFVVGDDGTLSTDIQAKAPDLFEAALLTAINLFKRENPDVIGTDKGDSSDSKSSYSKVTGNVLPPEALPLLADYRRVLVGRG